MQVDAPALPSAITDLLDGSDPGRHVGFTIQLLTVDPDGAPRVALLSAGEVVALDSLRVRIALWPDSHSTANLTRSGLTTLAFVFENAAYDVRLGVCRGEDLSSPTRLAVFEGRVAGVCHDVAPYAVLESGISFRLLDESSVVARWRATTEALVRHRGCDPDGDR